LVTEMIGCIMRSSLLEICCQICRGGGCSRAGFGAATSIELLVELWAMQRWAHDAAAENGINIVVHAHTTSQAVNKGAVVRSLHGISPAQRTASSHLLSRLPSKRWLAFDRFACNTIASHNFLSGLRCVDWILAGSHQ